MANSYSDSSGLIESTTYYYKVVAVDTAGNIGVLSDEANATTGDSTAPAKVMDVDYYNQSSSQLNWLGLQTLKLI